MSGPLAQQVWYWASSLVLSILLFFPASRLIWIVRVRGFERKQKREATDEERQRERRRARIIGAIIAVTFAFLFNRVFFGSL